jgi:hypothetical protein
MGRDGNFAKLKKVGVLRNEEGACILTLPKQGKKAQLEKLNFRSVNSDL